MKAQIAGEQDPSTGKEMLMYEWSMSHTLYSLLFHPLYNSHLVSKATLDIICETAFGYKTDSLHNPHNELAEAYEDLINLQSGTSVFKTSAMMRCLNFAVAANLIKMVPLLLLPGVPRLMASEWAYEHRYWFAKISALSRSLSLFEISLSEV